MSSPPPALPLDPELIGALRLSQDLGMLGARPVTEVVEQATAVVGALAELPGGSMVADLGSGGGVPGLVIARARPDLTVVLVDRRATRVDHLHRLIRRLELTDRVEAVAVDARNLAAHLSRSPDAVVARGFGSPETLLRVARPLLPPDHLIVATAPPPGAQDRWTEELLARYRVRREPSDRQVVVLRTDA